MSLRLSRIDKAKAQEKMYVNVQENDIVTYDKHPRTTRQ
jgi:hypothetical protein